MTVGEIDAVMRLKICIRLNTRIVYQLYKSSNDSNHSLGHFCTLKYFMDCRGRSGLFWQTINCFGNRNTTKGLAYFFLLYLIMSDKIALSFYTFDIARCVYESLLCVL